MNIILAIAGIGSIYLLISGLGGIGEWAVSGIGPFLVILAVIVLLAL